MSPCDLETATAVAKRIRKSVEELQFLKSEGLNIQFTVSIGVALFPDHANSKDAVIRLADQAMYKAKKTSRNTVFVMPVEKEKRPKASKPRKPPAKRPR